MKTFIKYLGNKSKYLKYLLPHVPENMKTYIEPFVGSGALFLKLEPNTWIINDLNEDIINVWRSVKDDSEIIIEIFKEFGKRFKKMSKSKKIEMCKKITEELNVMPYDIKRASIYMLMKHCAYMGNIVVQNKYFCSGLEMHIFIQNKTINVKTMQIIKYIYIYVVLKIKKTVQQ